MLTGKRGYLQLRLIDRSGQELVRLDRMRADGPISIAPLEKLQNKAHRDYFREAVALPEEAYYLSQLTLNRENGVIDTPHRPVLRMAKALYSAQGDVAAVVVVNMDARTMLNGLDLERGQSWLLNSRGDYLHHPDPAKRFGFDLEKPQLRFPDHWIEGVQGELVSSWLPEESDYHWVPELKRIVSLERIELLPGSPEHVWRLIRTLPGEAILEPLQKVVLSVLLFLSLVITAVVVRSTKAFVRPIQELMVMATRVGQGDFSARSKISSEDELGKLSATFNQMADNLKQSRDSLRRVEEALSAMDDLLIVVDSGGMITQINHSVERVVGVDREKLIGKPLQLLFKQQHRMLEGEHFSDEIARMVGGGLQSKLEREPQEFLQWVQAAPLPILICQQDGVVERVNGMTEALLGYLQGELEGSSIDRLLSGESAAEKPLTTHLSEEHSRAIGDELLVNMVCREGSPLTVELAYYRLQRGGEALFVVIMRDAFMMEDWDEILASPFGQLLAPSEERGVFQGVERQLKLANGSELPLLISGRVAYQQRENRQGKAEIERVILVAKDISQLRRTELELGERELLTEQLQQRSRELNEKIEQMEVMHLAFVDREARVIEMKIEINRLKERLGEAAPYNLEGLE